MPMSLLSGIPNPYSGAFAGDYFHSTGFVGHYFFPTWEASPEALDQVFTKGFYILLFSNTVAVGKAL
jgi:hypothetical protein